ncbi:hypothetical protein IC229_05850 [Spirosoma sp. BT702]|uniref:Uncharacterized protein n=1 Tax=Spirosoma profusum TaxID=2771354 RepID=A0A926XUC6_9BACT|nr:hypothetical protein [Spirosoma profusum]MBD2700149.1 hypothetical protein [Spirosoma profusum]
MDLTTIGNDLLKFSPLAFVLAVAVYVLWKKLEVKDTDLKDTMKAHDADRKETQEKLTQVLAQNSASHVQLSESVNNLTKATNESRSEIGGRLSALESQTKLNRSVRKQAIG